MSNLEIIASLLGVANIVLLVRRSAWNYAFGLAMVALYALIFFDERLYSDALLQPFFFVVQLYGWWEWLKGQMASGDVVVERLGTAGWVRWTFVVLPGWALWSWAMHRWTNAYYPFWDGAVAALSIAAQVMLARRCIENWVLWIAVDVIAVSLYLTRGLMLTAALYMLFLAMSVWGLIEWRRVERRQAEGGAVTTGLVAGRFLPPHAGHQLLVDTASALTNSLVLLLLVADDDPIPADLREHWLRAMFPKAQVVRGGRTASAIDGCVPFKIDLVFAGDGEEVAIASSLGARYVQLDPHLQAVPVRSRDVRADPLAYWPYLPAPVRPHYARTICLHGPESTGKSTLAPALAAHYETLWLPEYGRTYCEAFGMTLTMADLLAIAHTHQAMIGAAKTLCNRRLILDTDPLMTAAWAEMLFESADPWFGQYRDTADLYLLLDIDMPWIDDGTRFFGGERERRRFFECARDQLERSDIPYALIGGPPEERFERALEAIAAAGLG